MTTRQPVFVAYPARDPALAAGIMDAVRKAIRILIQTPGFSTKRDWIIHKLGQQVEIEPDPDR